MKTTNGERAGERLVQSRRSFIKAAGAAALGMAALGAAGCAAQNPQNDKAASANEIAWDEECDVLVVGAGAAGLATALTVATEGGGAKTLLLEKGSSELGNGNSIFSSGVIFTGDDSGRLFEYLKELRGGFTGTPDAILKAFADEMIHHREWLNGLGATDEQLIDYPSKAAEWSELPHADATSAIYFNKEDPDGMTHVVKFLDAALADHADTVTRLTEAPLTALVQDPETKQVLGGVYEHRSKSVYVKATKGVVMTCGGFENDDVMKQDYLSYPKSHPAAGLCNTGDGHRICGKLGADMWHMNSFAGGWNNAVKLDGSEMAPYRMLKKNQGISVGTNGRRYYMDWDGSTMYKDWAGTDLSLNYGCRHGHQNFGGDWASLPQPSVSWFVFDSNGLAKNAYLGKCASTNTLMTQTQTTQDKFDVDPAEDGYGYKADTIEDLAGQMGVPVDELVKTIAIWNDGCAKGEDDRFYRPADTLVPIDTPPYYAVKCLPEVLNTDGGPRRNEKGQIVDLDGEPIPRLYSAGEFGSVWCDKYQGAGNISECLAFGRIAARNVLGERAQ